MRGRVPMEEERPDASSALHVPGLGDDDIERLYGMSNVGDTVIIY